jgi:hypothetical protein
MVKVTCSLIHTIHIKRSWIVSPTKNHINFVPFVIFLSHSHVFSFIYVCVEFEISVKPKSKENLCVLSTHYGLFTVNYFSGVSIEHFEVAGFSISILSFAEKRYMLDFFLFVVKVHIKTIIVNLIWPIFH